MRFSLLFETVVAVCIAPFFSHYVVLVVQFKFKEAHGRGTDQVSYPLYG